MTANPKRTLNGKPFYLNHKAPTSLVGLQLAVAQKRFHAFNTVFGSERVT
jgi:hypothetical protein